MRLMLCFFMEWKCGLALSHLVHGIKSRQSKQYSHLNNWSKILNILSYHAIRTSALPIDVLTMQSVHKYIMKFKNLPDHRLPNMLVT